MAVDFIIGRKVGMTRIFDDLGSDYPVTIVEAGPCEITQIKSINNEGYSSIQIGYLEKEVRHMNIELLVGVEKELLICQLIKKLVK